MARKITRRTIQRQLDHIASSKADYELARRDYAEINANWVETQRINWVAQQQKLTRMISTLFGKRESVLFNDRIGQ